MLTRAKWRRGLMTAVIASLCLSVGGAFAWDFSKIEPTTTVFVDGVGETAQDRFVAFSECSDKALERGEYETKQEFEERKRNAQSDCASLRRVKSYLERKVILKYNADEFFFTFRIAEGDLSVPKDRFKHGKILVSYNFFDRSCPPTTVHPSKTIAKRGGVYTSHNAEGIMKRGGVRFGFSKKYDCPSIRLSDHKDFFTGGRASLPLVIQYRTQRNCVCRTKGMFGGCNIARCPPHKIDGPDKKTSFTLMLDSSIERARALKAMEDSLRLRLEGEFISWRNKKGYFFEMQRVVLVNRENDTTLFSVSGGG